MPRIEDCNWSTALSLVPTSVHSQPPAQHPYTKRIPIRSKRIALRPAGKLCLLEVDESWFTRDSRSDYSDLTALVLLRDSLLFTENITNWSTTTPLACRPPSDSSRPSRYLNDGAFSFGQVRYSAYQSLLSAARR